MKFAEFGGLNFVFLVILSELHKSYMCDNRVWQVCENFREPIGNGRKGTISFNVQQNRVVQARGIIIFEFLAQLLVNFYIIDFVGPSIMKTNCLLSKTNPFFSLQGGVVFNGLFCNHPNSCRRWCSEYHTIREPDITFGTSLNKGHCHSCTDLFVYFFQVVQGLFMILGSGVLL